MNNQIIKSLFQLSLEELNSAKLLYKKGYYSSSLFLFQQSIEKAYKAYGLMSRELEIEDLHKIGHDFFKHLRKSINSLSKEAQIQSFESTEKIFNQKLTEDPESILLKLKNITRDNFFYLNEKEIEHLCNLMNNLKNRLIKKSNDPEVLSEYLKLSLISGKLEEEEIKDFSTDPKDFKPFNDSIWVALVSTYSINFQFLGLITSAHSEQTRYPMKSTDYKCPTKLYNSEFPLIKNQKKLMKIATESIEFFVKQMN